MFGKHLLKRLIAIATVGSASVIHSVADNHFDLGTYTFSVPAGWTLKNRVEERVTFGAPDGRQQATVSLMRFNSPLAFDDFKKLCSLRYDAEKKGAPEIYLNPAQPTPHQKNGTFSMNFTGAENGNRIFSGLLNFKGQELITIYVEGLGIDSTTLADTFDIFTSTLKGN